MATSIAWPLEYDCYYNDDLSICVYIGYFIVLIESLFFGIATVLILIIGCRQKMT